MLVASIPVAERAARTAICRKVEDTDDCLIEQPYAVVYALSLR
jgi:hypothetical protein